MGQIANKVAITKAEWFNPPPIGALQVHGGQKGELWCENNRNCTLQIKHGRIKDTRYEDGV